MEFADIIQTGPPFVNRRKIRPRAVYPWQVPRYILPEATGTGARTHDEAPQEG